MRRLRCVQPLVVMLLGGAAFAQTNLQNSGLQYAETITIPGWKATGASGNANVDLMGFNPTTRMMYLADRTNNGIDVIDTRDNLAVGFIPMPATSKYGTPVTGPNGVLVTIQTQQLVVTDGLQNVYVWDLRAPQSAPDTYTLPTSLGTDTDGIAYDPVNNTVYVVTDNPPEYLVGISLVFKTIVSQTPLPVSSDLIAYNPTDGKIYIAAEDADPGPPNTNAQAGVWAYDPTSGNPGTVTLVTKVGPACPGHGIAIDPVSNIAVVGCFGGTGDKGDIAVNLSSGKLLNTFTDVGGTDAVVFDPNNRRFYAAAGLNTASTSGCPSPKAGPAGATVPIVGVVNGSNGSLAGVACTGGGHIVGVDPISNNIYVPVSQYPPDPNDTTTGANGVVVLYDHTPPAQPPVTQAQASLMQVAGATASGTVQFTLINRHLRVIANPIGLPSSAHAAWISVPTTVGDEVVACAVNTSGTAVCNEDLIGEPLIGAVVTLSTDAGGSSAAARGTISLPGSH